MSDQPRNLHFACELDPTTEIARVGLVNMWVDERGEDAFKSLMPANVRVFTTRLAVDLHAYNTRGEFRPVGGFEQLSQALPVGRIDVIAFSCTSGAIAYGEGKLAANFSAVHPNVPVTNPATGSAGGLKAAGVKRIALLTPYPLPMHSKFVPFFERQGLQVVADGTYGIEASAEIPRVSEHSIVDAGERLLNYGGDALFISCTAMDTVERLPSLSRALGKPVFSSAQLFAWSTLDRLGLDAEASRVLSRSHV